MNTTIQQKGEKSLPPLTKGSSTYKLIVPANVEEKIRYLLRKFPHTEWSGVLFYTHEGTFENSDLVITCQDIFPMDLGNATYTEFNMSEDVAAYMADNIDLFDCDTSLIHSHHTMSSQFSSTDMKTLQTEGNDTNCFVSLIVNTAGTYSAKITRKVQTKSEVIIKKLGSSYEFFGEGSREVTHDGSETTKTIDKEVIEYFDLKVERQEVPNTLGYLDARFDEIERKKASNAPIRNMMQHRDMEDRGFFDYLHSGRTFDDSQEPNLFGEKEASQPPTKVKTKEEINPLDIDWHPDPKEIHAAVVHIITLNLILNPEKIDLRQWVMKHMANVYKKVFGESCLLECHNECGGPFTEYKDFIIQFTIDHFNYDTVPDALMENDSDYVYGMVAQAIINEIFEYVEVSPFIKSYYEELSMYL